MVHGNSGKYKNTHIHTKAFNVCRSRCASVCVCVFKYLLTHQHMRKFSAVSLQFHARVVERERKTVSEGKGEEDTQCVCVCVCFWW